MNAIELYKHKDKLILISAVKFKELKDIVKFTERKDSNWSISDTNDHDFENNFYQRKLNEKRLQGLKSYIKENLFKDESDESETLFPSALILSLEIDLDHLRFENEIVSFDLPSEKESCLIVDGQHRMYSMRSVYNELSKVMSDKLSILDEYKFNCTFLINHDLWEQANIFASVNFNQKPVDRSLYYDIFGEAPDNKKDRTKSSLYIAHELGKFLNTSAKSPLKGFVRNFDRKQGFVSQAFLMNAILLHLGPKGTWSQVTDDYKNEGLEFKKLPKVFVAYFEAIKELLSPYWPLSIEKNASTILSKTTGLGALIKLLGHINTSYRLGFVPSSEPKNLLELEKEELDQLFRSILTPLAKKEKNDDLGLADKYFGETSKYAGSGSVGAQNQLFKELASEIGIPVKDRSSGQINN